MLAAWAASGRAINHNKGVANMIKTKPRLSTVYHVGDRVELHPATDRWMSGDRYGAIVKVTRKLVHILLDKSGNTAKMHPSHIGAII